MKAVDKSPDTPTVEELQAMLERAEKATPGPWEWWKYGLRQGERGPYVIDERRLPEPDGVKDGDLEFIAHARTDLPRVVRCLLEIMREKSE